jgi:hypothetical protein
MKKILIILFIALGCQTSEKKVFTLDSLGIWEVKYFVNEFKEPTNVGYITNSEPIKGQYKNVKISNAKLNVKVMIKEDAIAFKLYENESKISVKGNRNDAIEYDIKIKHNDTNVEFIFKAYNETDVVIVGNVISSEHQEKLISYFKLGGSLKFYLEEKNHQRTIYNFEIINDPIFGFNNAMDKLINKI